MNKTPTINQETVEEAAHRATGSRKMTNKEVIEFINGAVFGANWHSNLPASKDVDAEAKKYAEDLYTTSESNYYRNTDGCNNAEIINEQEACISGFLAGHQHNTAEVERLRGVLEELEAVNMWLDKLDAAKVGEKGKLSTVGRIVDLLKQAQGSI